MSPSQKIQCVRIVRPFFGRDADGSDVKFLKLGQQFVFTTQSPKRTRTMLQGLRISEAQLFVVDGLTMGHEELLLAAKIPGQVFNDMTDSLCHMGIVVEPDVTIALRVTYVGPEKLQAPFFACVSLDGFVPVP